MLQRIEYETKTNKCKVIDTRQLEWPGPTDSGYSEIKIYTLENKNISSRQYLISFIISIKLNIFILLKNVTRNSYKITQ